MKPRGEVRFGGLRTHVSLSIAGPRSASTLHHLPRRAPPSRSSDDSTSVLHVPSPPPRAELHSNFHPVPVPPEQPSQSGTRRPARFEQLRSRVEAQAQELESAEPARQQIEKRGEEETIAEPVKHHRRHNVDDHDESDRHSRQTQETDRVAPFEPIVSRVIFHSDLHPVPGPPEQSVTRRPARFERVAAESRRALEAQRPGDQEFESADAAPPVMDQQVLTAHHDDEEAEKDEAAEAEEKGEKEEEAVPEPVTRHTGRSDGALDLFDSAEAQAHSTRQDIRHRVINCRLQRRALMNFFTQWLAFASRRFGFAERHHMRSIFRRMKSKSAEKRRERQAKAAFMTQFDEMSRRYEIMMERGAEQQQHALQRAAVAETLAQLLQVVMTERDKREIAMKNDCERGHYIALWCKIENSLKRKVEPHPWNQNLFDYLTGLGESRKLEQEYVDKLQRMRTERNSAAHKITFTPQQGNTQELQSILDYLEHTWHRPLPHTGLRTHRMVALLMRHDA